jgi:hypothetical protein
MRSTTKACDTAAGVYLAADGRKIEVSAPGDRLTMAATGKSFALEAAGGSTFLATDPDFQSFPFVFGRAGKPAPDPVTELSYGEDWYVNNRYAGPKTFPNPPEFAHYTGHYVSYSPWAGSTTVVLRKGSLWLDGVTPLTPLGGGLFRLGMADAVEFHYVVEGMARLVNINGFDFRRT